MKYYSEKLNKMFDTEDELCAAENEIEEKRKNWDMKLSIAIGELGEANRELERVVDKCIRDIGEKECDNLLNKIYNDVSEIQTKPKQDEKNASSIKIDSIEGLINYYVDFCNQVLSKLYKDE